ncbi:MAG: Gfo/Idh/MocA family oxidoreductase [Ruminococcaceae bacterium]|nr:Gfo/Idh/MocA family oxidoreductase [Oscillospiraceae bacterium]
MSEKIRFGVIGGRMGSGHMVGIESNEDAVLVAICEKSPETMKNCANRFGVSEEHCYDDYKEMLEKEELDAVVVATPDQLHCECTVAALKKGCHVICEKPMALTTEECREMIAASKETGKLLMIGQVCRKAPGFVLAKKLIEDGEIGELFFVESEYAHDYSRIPGVGNWRIDPVHLRHPIIGGGCHAIDLLRWLAGNPSEVYAYSNRKMLKDWPVDDCTVAIMKFPNEVVGKVFTSVGCKRTYTMRTVLYGSTGTIITDNTSEKITLMQEVVDENGKASIKTTELPVDVNNHNVTAEIKELTEAILGRAPLITDGKEGASTVAVGCAIVESAATGKPVCPSYDF